MEEIITRDVMVTDEVTGQEVLLRDLRDFEHVVSCRRLRSGDFFVRVECDSGGKRAFIFDKKGLEWGWVEDDGIGFREDFPFSDKEKMLLVDCFMSCFEED